MKWTQINESMIQDRESGIAFASDMSELDASLAISEAISFAAEGKYIAEGLFKDILSFNKKAEDREYSVEEYISEAFSVSGIFEKILNFIKKVWDNIVKFFKNFFESSSPSSVSSSISSHRKVVKEAKKVISEADMDKINGSVDRDALYSYVEASVALTSIRVWLISEKGLLNMPIKFNLDGLSKNQTLSDIARTMADDFKNLSDAAKLSDVNLYLEDLKSKFGNNPDETTLRYIKRVYKISMQGLNEYYDRQDIKRDTNYKTMYEDHIKLLGTFEDKDIDSITSITDMEKFLISKVKYMSSAKGIKIDGSKVNDNIMNDFMKGGIDRLERILSFDEQLLDETENTIKNISKNINDINSNIDSAISTLKAQQQDPNIDPALLNNIMANSMSIQSTISNITTTIWRLSASMIKGNINELSIHTKNLREIFIK